MYRVFLWFCCIWYWLLYASKYVHIYVKRTISTFIRIHCSKMSFVHYNKIYSLILIFFGCWNCARKSFRFCWVFIIFNFTFHFDDVYPFLSVTIVPWVCEYSYDALLWPRNYVYTIHILYLYWTLTYCKLRVINMQYTHYYKWSLYP